MPNNKCVAPQHEVLPGQVRLSVFQNNKRVPHPTQWGLPKNIKNIHYKKDPKTIKTLSSLRAFNSSFVRKILWNRFSMDHYKINTGCVTCDSAQNFGSGLAKKCFFSTFLMHFWKLQILLWFIEIFDTLLHYLIVLYIHSRQVKFETLFNLSHHWPEVYGR